MSLAREEMMAHMRARTRSLCVTCLSKAINIPFDMVMVASQDGRFRQVYDRGHGTCPECGTQQLLFHPPPKARSRRPFG
jgi:hypothetical protein